MKKRPITMINRSTFLTAESTLYFDSGKIEKRVLDSFFKAMQLTDLLFMISKTDLNLDSTERLLFNKLTDTLASGSECLDADNRDYFLKQVRFLRAADYDMGNITYSSGNSTEPEFLFGKVISPDNENRKLYGAVFGILNKKLQDFVESFAISAGKLFDNRALPGCHDTRAFSDIKSGFRCIDVVKLAGELNRKQKPVSVFYSGSSIKKIALLPKVAVFSNIYLERYRAVSSRLGKKLIDNYKYPADEYLLSILVGWLRGHDLGHVFGADNLGMSMRSNRAEYYILHELKSDVVALLLMKRTAKELFNDDIDKIYTVFLSEMFRYMRKGEFSKFPDSGAAFYIFKYFRENHAIKKNSKTGKFIFYIAGIDECCEKLAGDLFGLFENGSLNDALSLINRYGAIANTGSDDINEAVPQIFDREIPLYVEFDFKIGPGQ